MDNLLSTFLTWQFMLFSLSVVTVTYVVRKIVEYIGGPTMFKNKFWNELFLPIAPIVNGGFIAWLIPMYPYPEDIKSVGTKILFGLVAGFLSGTTYKIFKGLLKQKSPELADKLPDSLGQ